MISKNNSRISLGTIVRLWHDTRGHDYVVVGVSRRDKKIALIKHNCINRDGSIHASTANYYLAHKTLNYSSSGFISGINSITGTCTRLKKAELTRHFMTSNFDCEFNSTLNLHCHPTIDRRTNTYY